jgi:hypothetical protein
MSGNVERFDGCYIRENISGIFSGDMDQIGNTELILPPSSISTTI